MATKEQMKKEAIQRMYTHDLLKGVIDIFEHDDMIMCSEYGISMRSLTLEELKMVRNYEKISHCLVYHVIHADANIGETYELLRVSPYKEDWEYENANLDKGYILVRSENKTIPDYSESGTIIVMNNNGILKRIG